MIKAFAVDDEQLSLDRFEILLEGFDDVTLVGTATNGQAALEAIGAGQPDVLFLDVEMPGLDGFDVAERVARAGGAAPLVVFITAYPNFAPEAFDSGAIDFLTKPVRLSRLAACLDRVRAALEGRIARDRLEDLLGQLEMLRSRRLPGEEEHDYLWVQRHGEAVRLDLSHVERICAEGEYVRLFIGGKSYLHRESLTAMAERMDSSRFTRVHRSHLVRRERVVSIVRRGVGGYALTLEDGIVVPVGRRYRSVVRAFAAGPKQA